MNKQSLILLFCLLFIISCKQNNNSTQAQINKLEQNLVKSAPTATSVYVNANSSQNVDDDNAKPQIAATISNLSLKPEHSDNPKLGEHYKPFWIEDDEQSDNGYEPFCVNIEAEGKVITKCGYQNTDGKILIKPAFARTYVFSEGLAGVCPKMEQLCGYINERGKLVVKANYQDVDKFSEGLAGVLIGDVDFYKLGYLDKSGRFVIKPQYSDGKPFKNGVAQVEVQRSLLKCINKKNQTVKCD